MFIQNQKVPYKKVSGKLV